MKSFLVEDKIMFTHIVDSFSADALVTLLTYFPLYSALSTGGVQ